MGQPNQIQVMGAKTQALESVANNYTDNKTKVMQQRTSDIEGIMNTHQQGEGSHHADGNRHNDVSNLGPGPVQQHHEHGRRHSEHGPEIQINNFGDRRDSRRFKTL